MWQKNMPWDDACRAFVDGLSKMNTDATIRALPRRLSLCVAARGGHIEDKARL